MAPFLPFLLITTKPFMHVVLSLETHRLLVSLPPHYRLLQIREPLRALTSFSVGRDTLAMLAASWGEVNWLKSIINVYSYNFSILFMNCRKRSFYDNGSHCQVGSLSPCPSPRAWRLYMLRKERENSASGYKKHLGISNSAEMKTRVVI